MSPRLEPRRGTPSALVIVGLANPGSDYEGTRHNVGGEAIRRVVARRGLRLSAERRQHAESISTTTPLGQVTLAIPTAFMNESGSAIKPLLKRTSLTDLSKLVVVHDELDLEPGRLQIKIGGGLAGHNGLRSISGVLKSQEFARVRIGIGKPPTKEQGADWVLKRLTGSRRDELNDTIERAADVIEMLMDVGVEETQRRTNAS